MNSFTELIRFIRHTLYCTLALGLFSFCAYGGDLQKLGFEDFNRLRAERWRAVGKNIIVEGNVYMPFGPLEIFADQIIINLESKDFEAAGNIRLFRWQETAGDVSLERLAELEKQTGTLVRDVTSSVDIFGNRTYTAKIACQTDNITADRILGNLDTSYFRFDNAKLRYSTFVCRAESGERRSDGVILIRNGEVSSCSYLESDNSHYSIAASELKLVPHKARFYELEHADFDPGDREVILTNGFAKIYGIPVLWLPFFYKPKDQSPGLFSVQWGESSDWGYYLSMSKKFVFSDYPAFSAKLRADWYELRGVGYGISGEVVTEESYTDFLAYSIYDIRPYESEDYDKYRLKVPHGRFNFKLSNVTHITPRLDFRGNFEYSSDRYFRRDFFSSRYNADPQPATFAALEQQFDHLSAALYMRMQVNDFYSTVEKLPEVRVDVQRQELFDTGIYYQGDASFTNFRMKWIEFDERPKGKYTKLKDYDALRFDTTHFLYYPLKNRFFTLVPRAGVKFTAYSDSSKQRISDSDLITMFSAADPQGNGQLLFKNYDDDGNARARFAAELGFELSTKIHNTWQNARNSFMEIDGIRHIMQPYLNYTYITNPTMNRNRLYYFDDIDRLDEQNFVRFGLINRLQTRSGDSVSSFFTMENFWDLYLDNDEQSRLGNIGTIMRLKLFKGLSLHTQFLIDISGDGEVQDTIRRGRNVGKTGLALNWLNQWDIGLSYSPAADWDFNISYNYLRPYSTRAAYSMGSTLTQVNATSYFQRYYTDRNEVLSIGGNMPLTPDHRTLGFFNMTYDFEAGSIDTLAFTVLRKFHCWQLVAMLGFEREFEDHEPNWDISYSIQANLTGLNAPMNNVQNAVLRGINDPETNVVSF